ncbi:MAG: DUF2974 domain-containing protein [Clostridia bacterium]|nr:DUF2974 domain-containing protein [Clostridia bacterium]
MNYLTEYADTDFRQHPFTAVDALVLCQLSYPKIDRIVPADGFMSIEAVAGHPDSDALYTDRIFGEMYREFVTKVVASERYRGFEAGLFKALVSESEEYQFAAVTFRMPGDRYFVAFRGTDEKVVGWKEDFNMGHLAEVPSQAIALDYLNSVPGAGPVFVGGHSKGGNQAIYAAAKADRSVRERITGIYSFDGMGMGEDFYSSPEYAEIRNRITKIIPDESIIGTLFERPENCLIVRSDSRGIKQHDFMKWHVREGHFEYCDSLKPAAALLAERLKKWIDSLDGEEREKFVDSIYSLVLACQPDEIYSLGDDAFRKVQTVIGELRNMDEESRTEIRSTLLKLIRA